MIAKILRAHASKYPDKKAIVHLNNRKEPNASLTYKEWDAQSGALAALLAKCELANEKVILLYPTGLDFVIGYLACHYAGVIPVPVAPPDPAQLTQTVNHLLTVIEDSGAMAILTTTSIQRLLPESLTVTTIVASEAVHPTEYYFQPMANEDAVAHLQYSSGTTGRPKAIVITQANIIQSLNSNSLHWLLTEQDIALTWTPHYYIYGLLTGILLPLYNANTNYILNTLEVVNNPLHWLQNISAYQVTYSGSANFGYQLCVDKISAAEIAALDLSHWQIAICGGELIQAHTLQQFADKFKASGFQVESLNPSYGLSEMTGFVSAKLRGAKFKLHTQNREYVSSGHVASNTILKIIQPDSNREVADGVVGEICLSSPTLTRGYVHQSYPEVGIDGHSYYRTGDLGFILAGELYLASRLKETIIMNGKNYYPEDIEASARRGYLEFPNDAMVAIAVVGEATEQVVLLRELTSDMTQDKMQVMINAMRASVLKYNGVRLSRIILLKSAGLPKTRSGKLQRAKAKQDYLAGKLPVIFADNITSEPVHSGNLVAMLQDSHGVERKKIIEQQLQRLMHDTLKISPSSLADSKFFDLGMTSLLAVEFKERLQSLLSDSITLSPSFVFEYPSIQAMAGYIEKHF